MSAGFLAQPNQAFTTGDRGWWGRSAEPRCAPARPAPLAVAALCLLLCLCVCTQRNDGARAPARIGAKSVQRRDAFRTPQASRGQRAPAGRGGHRRVPSSPCCVPGACPPCARLAHTPHSERCAAQRGQDALPLLRCLSWSPVLALAFSSTLSRAPHAEQTINGEPQQHSQQQQANCSRRGSRLWFAARPLSIGLPSRDRWQRVHTRRVLATHTRTY